MQKQKFIGGVDFEELRAQRIQVYNTITIDLSTARSDEKMTYTGTYLYVIDATDINTSIQIRLNEQFRSLIPLMKGRGIRAPFYRFYITNTAQVGKTITLAIGIESETFEIFDVGKALEVTGTIDEIKQLTKIIQDDSWRYETDQGHAFMGGGSQGASATERSVIQLWNPAASGVIAYVKKAFAHLVLTTGDYVTLRYHNAQLQTAALASGNKLIGGSAPNCEVNRYASATISGTEITTIKIKDYDRIDMIKANPFRLSPGYGIHFNCVSVNQELIATFEWDEVAA